MTRPTNLKREIEKSKICVPPNTPKQKKAFENGNRLPPLPSFDTDQVGDLPEIQIIPLDSSIKTPKKIH
jgi:hypothetical protein